ncbi:hypothetical protein ABZ780_02705 [Micromonospora sp. NPDC047467]|uniref:hypothetical protein n=1 Tax=Micromonospora sp. NPDC047467 TaxID=3154814 RepID=UPI0033C2EFE9
MTDPTPPPPDEPTEPAVPPPASPVGDVPPGEPLPPTKGRRSHLRAWAIGGVALVVALSCGGVVIGAVTGDNEEPAASGGSPISASPSTAIPTTAAPSTAAPTASPTIAEPTAVAPTTTPPAPKPKVIKGRGDDVVRIPALTDFAVVKFVCRCSSNTILRSDGPEGLLVNEIGAYTGKRWINLEDGALTTQFEVEAAGSWTLTIGSLDQMATKATSGKVSGKGDDVVILGGDATAVKITHSRGSSNFAVYAYSLESGEGGLLVNEIGGYSGVRPLTAPALMEITADGNWTIAPA